MSESEQLEYELNYRVPQGDNRFFKTHPPGYNVISGLGAFFALTGFLLGMLATVAKLGQSGFAEVAGFFVGLIVAAILGWKLPRAFWRAIGPGGRSALRVFGSLGPGAVLILCFLLSALLVGGLRGLLSGVSTEDRAEKVERPVKATVETPTPTVVKAAPLSGPDWQVLVDANNKPLKLTLAQARLRCKALGDDWRLPMLNDAAMVDSKVTHPTWRACVFHFDNGRGKHGILEFRESVNGWDSTATKDDVPRHVLCLRGQSV